MNSRSTASTAPTRTRVSNAMVAQVAAQPARRARHRGWKRRPPGASRTTIFTLEAVARSAADARDRDAPHRQHGKRSSRASTARSTQSGPPPMVRVGERVSLHQRHDDGHPMHQHGVFWGADQRRRPGGTGATRKHTINIKAGRKAFADFTYDEPGNLRCTATSCCTWSGHVPAFSMLGDQPEGADG